MSALLAWLKRRRTDQGQQDPTASSTPTLRTDRYEHLPEAASNDLLRFPRKKASRFVLAGIDRDWVAFFIFGCINNLIYVVILSAAVDLVGAQVPKGIVLLADIMPSLLIKMVAPYFIHKVPYPLRVTVCASLSFSAVVIIALADTIKVRLLGVMMASLSSGLGELTFLMLSSFYRLQMVSAWSSGTGGAGLLGSLLFLALTSWLGLSIPRTLGVVAMFPILLLVAYFLILTNPSSPSASRYYAVGYRPISSSSQIFSADADMEEEFLASPQDTHRPNHHRSSLSEPHGLPPSLLSSVPPLLEVNGDSLDVDHSPGGRHRGSSMSTNTNTLLPSPPTSPLIVAAAESLQDDGSLSVVTTVPPIGSAIATSTSTSSAPATLLPPSPWDTPQWGVPQPIQHHTEPTSINTLLAATNPDDPGFVSPFRESEIGESANTRRRVYKVQPNESMTLEEKLAMARSLLVPYMVPLFLVYVAEYTMNQGVLPVILFPLDKTPFTHLRDHYVTYSAIYQLGVFISRSSASVLQIPRLWIPSFLQLLTLLLATSQALLSTSTSAFPIPSVYLIFGLILWEGLLGGATYVHTYIGISKDLEHDPKGKEFALGVVGVADGLGIMVAGLASLWIEPALCRWQVVEKGVELCLAMAD